MIKLAAKETVQDRLSYCDPCDHNKLGICKQCGCLIQGKTRLADTSCPMGWWGKEEFGIKSLVED